jgi:uncharacterized protein (DUF2141 family)
MENVAANTPGPGVLISFFNFKKKQSDSQNKGARKLWILLAATMLFSPIAFAQNTPQVTGVDPAMGKVNDTLTLTGTNLGKEAVSAVYLSDDTKDYKATVVEQTDDKITAKVPNVKAGSYNVSIQVGKTIFIKPIKFEVEQ